MSVALRVALALGLLNVLLSFENRWPGFGVTLRPRLSIELCVLLAGLIAWQAWRGRLLARTATLLALGVGMLVLLRYADVTAPALLGRKLNFYWDGRHAGELLADALNHRATFDPAGYSPSSGAVSAAASGALGKTQDSTQTS